MCCAPRTTRVGLLILAVSLLMVCSSAWGDKNGATSTEAQENFAQGFGYHTGKEGEPDLKRALAYYHKALQQDPELFPALYNAALIYHFQKNYKRALLLFNKAARAARSLEEKEVESEALARNGLGNCYQMDGKLQEAKKQFGVAIRMHPQLVEAHYNLINLLIKEERWEEARQALISAEEVAPSSKYKIFTGRLKGREGRKGIKAVGGWIGVVAILALMLLYALYQRTRLRSQ